MMFVREEFMQLTSTQTFLGLDKSTIMEILESDFVQVCLISMQTVLSLSLVNMCVIYLWII